MSPQTGLLKGRKVVEKLHFTDTSYCKYDYPHKKATRIWHNLGDYLQLQPTRSRATPCNTFKANGRHEKSAQRGSAKRDGQRMKDDTFSLARLYSIPPLLRMHISLACDLVYSINETQRTIHELLPLSLPSSEAAEEDEDRALC